MVLKIIQKIFLWSIVSIGTLVILTVLILSSLVYFKNDQIIKQAELFSIRLNESQLNVELAINKTIELIGSNSTNIDNSKTVIGVIDNAINHLKNSSTNVDQETIKILINDLNKIKSHLITGGDINNLIIKTKLLSDKLFSSTHQIVDPILNWIKNNSKNVSLYILIGTSSFLSITLILSILLTILKCVKKNKNKK